jgi:hypothetical protein
MPMIAMTIINSISVKPCCMVFIYFYSVNDGGGPWTAVAVCFMYAVTVPEVNIKKSTIYIDHAVAIHPIEAALGPDVTQFVRNRDAFDPPS